MGGMKTTIPRKLTFIVTLLCVASTSAFASRRPASSDNTWPTQPVIQLALLLDTSNSMDGLIDQARTRLWQIVNELARARHAGQCPRLEVALYEYGNSGLSRESGYIREVTGFTDDLDYLSAKLFALHTNGGNEYCGTVIDRALGGLVWSDRPNDLKLIFIAGNEPFSQGPISYRKAVRTAFARGITVNTIFCGPALEGIQTGWQDGALIAEGTYSSIDQNQAMPCIDAPQDRELARLNEALNRTYIAYGTEGESRAENQRAQDANTAAAAPSSLFGRIASKASTLYRNSTWDLVDAVKEEAVDLDELDEKELPKELRDLSPEERRRKVEAASAERADVQRQIQELAAERESYIATELAKNGGNAEAALDEAIVKSVRAQAGKKNYTFE